MRAKLAEARKAVVAVVGALAEIVSLGLLHGRALDIANVVITLATATGVYVVPNYTPQHAQGASNG